MSADDSENTNNAAANSGCSPPDSGLEFSGTTCERAEWHRAWLAFTDGEYYHRCRQIMLGYGMGGGDVEMILANFWEQGWIAAKHHSATTFEQQRLVRTPFVDRMEAELQANQSKGDWREWVPTPLQVTQELNYHFAKLIFAMAGGDHQRVSEFAADVANIAMKADEVMGSPNVEHTNR